MTAEPDSVPTAFGATSLRLWGLLLSMALLMAGVAVVTSRTASQFVVESLVGEAPPAAVDGLDEAAAVVEAESADVEVAPAAAPPPEPSGPTQPPPPPDLPDGEVERIPLVDGGDRLEAFRGLSTWVDLYDLEIEPESQAARAAAGGVQTIFVQTARFNSPADIHDPGRLGRLIEAAHDLGLQVMTWYIPDHLDHGRDLRRAKAAIEFTTPRGDRADAFGLDIEMEKLPDVAERSRRLLRLSAELREWVGPDYPMAAIVLPPLQLDLRPRWWPGFPWAELRPHYDVFIPMSYSSYRGADPGTTHAWNLQNILQTRVRTGDPNLPIHMAGGIADRLPHVDAFVSALRDGKVVGGGLYDLHTTPPTSWPRLRALRAE